MDQDQGVWKRSEVLFKYIYTVVYVDIFVDMSSHVNDMSSHFNEMSLRINEITNRLSHLRDTHAGAVLVLSQHRRQESLLEQFEDEIKRLKPTGKQAFDEECAGTDPGAISDLERVMKLLDKERTDVDNELKEAKSIQKKEKELNANLITMKFIHAVNENDLGLVSNMLNFHNINVMQGPLEGHEVVDYSDFGRPAGPPSLIYGDSALLVAIRSQNFDLLDILLKHVPDWSLKLENLLAQGISEGKLYALAFVLRRKGFHPYHGMNLMNNKHKVAVVTKLPDSDL